MITFVDRMQQHGLLLIPLLVLAVNTLVLYWTHQPFLTLIGTAIGGVVHTIWSRRQRHTSAQHDYVIAQAEQATSHVRLLQKALAWQRDSMDVVSAATLPELAQRRAALAMQISGCHLDPQIGMPILSSDQTTALQILHTLADMRASQLEAQIIRDQNAQALEALWQVAGMLRYKHQDLRSAILPSCTEFAQALGLDWFALLAPDQHQPVSPVMLVHTTRQAPLLQPAQMRVAAEALRGERSLVRREGASALACLPIMRPGQATLVLAASGQVESATTQVLLFLLGEFLAHSPNLVGTQEASI